MAVTVTDETTECCIVCNGPTPYKQTDNVQFRNCYIEGAGQLCSECFKTESKNTKLIQDLFMYGQ